MFDDNFNFALERYKKELMEFAKRNKVTLVDVPEEDSVPAFSENEYYPATTNYERNYNPPMPLVEENVSDANDLAMAEEKVYSTYEDFLEDNPKSGSLRVQAFVAGRAFPVSNVKVSVTKQIADKPYVVAERMTDSSGIASNIRLPAPESNFSETPVTTQMPYATYDVLVEQPRYVSLLYKDVPIFDSIESIQPVEMRPRIEGMTNEMIVIDEKSEWNLSQEAE